MVPRTSSITASPLYSILGERQFSGARGDYLQASHSESLELSNGTIALTFAADSIKGTRALFSKDGKGYDDGGHLTAYLCDGRLYVRQQSDRQVGISQGSGL